MKSIIALLALGLLLTACTSTGDATRIAVQEPTNQEALPVKGGSAGTTQEQAPSEEYLSSQTFQVWPKKGATFYGLRGSEVTVAIGLTALEDSMNCTARITDPSGTVDWVTLEQKEFLRRNIYARNINIVAGVSGNVFSAEGPKYDVELTCYGNNTKYHGNTYFLVLPVDVEENNFVTLDKYLPSGETTTGKNFCILNGFSSCVSVTSERVLIFHEFDGNNKQTCKGRIQAAFAQTETFDCNRVLNSIEPSCEYESNKELAEPALGDISFLGQQDYKITCAR